MGIGSGEDLGRTIIRKRRKRRRRGEEGDEIGGRSKIREEE